jgi:hypothetical protein
MTSRHFSSFSMPGAKSLDEIIKKELIEGKTGEEVVRGRRSSLTHSVSHWIFVVF